MDRYLRGWSASFRGGMLPSHRLGNPPDSGGRISCRSAGLALALLSPLAARTVSKLHRFPVRRRVPFQVRALICTSAIAIESTCRERANRVRRVRAENKIGQEMAMPTPSGRTSPSAASTATFIPGTMTGSMMPPRTRWTPCLRIDPNFGAKRHSLRRHD